MRINLFKLKVKRNLMIRCFVFVLGVYILSCTNTVDFKSKEKGKQRSTAQNIVITNKLDSSIICYDSLKAEILLSENDSTFYVNTHITKDYRIFGYSEPNVNSEKVILFSVFTSDVDGNPFKCKYGAYYDMKYDEKYNITFQSIDGDFVKTKLTTNDGVIAYVYFEKRWVNLQ